MDELCSGGGGIIDGDAGDAGVGRAAHIDADIAVLRDGCSNGGTQAIADRPCPIGGELRARGSACEFELECPA